jgi:hypothetical protein
MQAEACPNVDCIVKSSICRNRNGSCVRLHFASCWQPRCPPSSLFRSKPNELFGTLEGYERIYRDAAKDGCAVAAAAGSTAAWARVKRLSNDASNFSEDDRANFLALDVAEQSD